MAHIGACFSAWDLTSYRRDGKQLFKHRGDLNHAVWKRKAGRHPEAAPEKRFGQPYAIGVWQITRETLRYAHALYLTDKRDYSQCDYSQLPERLRPPQTVELDLTNSHVLTAYAGLLLRDLLDHFNGDVDRAVGAYNGRPHNPIFNMPPELKPSQRTHAIYWSESQL